MSVQSQSSEATPGGEGRQVCRSRSSDESVTSSPGWALPWASCLEGWGGSLAGPPLPSHSPQSWEPSPHVEVVLGLSGTLECPPPMAPNHLQRLPLCRWTGLECVLPHAGPGGGSWFRGAAGAGPGHAEWMACSTAEGGSWSGGLGLRGSLDIRWPP